MMPRDSVQTRVAAVLLAATGDVGFVLAGAGAIRAHGLTDRPTYDVDLFAASTLDETDFAAAVTTGEQALVALGYRVSRSRSAPLFARLVVETPEREALEVDFGVDWRQEPPVRLAVGNVLSLRDAIGSKIAAAFSRGEIRDLLDVDSIRQSGRFTDAELLRFAKDHDDGFSLAVFAENLDRLATTSPDQTAPYGIDAESHREIAARLSEWARAIR